MDKKEKMINGINEVMGVLSIDRMPTSKELRDNNYSWLDGLISKQGGLLKVADELGIERIKKESTRDESFVMKELSEFINNWNIEYMPTRAEVLERSGHSLHNAISRNGGYRYFAEKLNLKIKDSETKIGQDYELKILKMLSGKGFSVENMTTKHPFDILVNNTVKIDVKVASLKSDNDGNPIHTFGINKKHASCDIYICIALDENKDIERLFIIPSHHLKVVTMCIGKDSKYNKYIDRFDYIEEYSKFFNSII